MLPYPIPFGRSPLYSHTELRARATRLRIEMLNMIYDAGEGHTGGSLSALDLLVALYFHELNVDPSNPKDPLRDRFVMSKGHSVQAYYCVLADRGFFPREELKTYGKFGTRLFGHPTTKVPGVELPTGALGHGLSVGVGMALGAKRDGSSYRTYVLMGDGEQAEGSIWEAAMSASHYELNNLVGIIDHNKLQISDEVDRVMRISSLLDRWTSFGWRVAEVDGHDFGGLRTAFEESRAEQSKPTLIVAHTKKGSGISFMENELSWHHRVPKEDELKAAIKELESKAVEIEHGNR